MDQFALVMKRFLGDTNDVVAARQAGWPLCLSYGMTEAGSQIATCCEPARDPRGYLLNNPGWTGSIHGNTAEPMDG